MAEEEEPHWETRFYVPEYSHLQWAADAFNRAVYFSTASGSNQLYTWNTVTRKHRQVTDHDKGLLRLGGIAPSGGRVYWFRDMSQGDEIGQWVYQPFDSTPDTEPTPIPGIPSANTTGFAVGGRQVVVGSAGGEAGRYVVHSWRTGEDHPTLIFQSERSTFVGPISRDGSLIAISHAEGDGLYSRNIEVIHTSSGRRIRVLSDGPDKMVLPIAFEPGTNRLLVSHSRHGRDGLLLWNLNTGQQTELDIPLPGDVGSALKVPWWYTDGTNPWYPDGSLLITSSSGGGSALHRLHLDTGELIPIPTPAGVVRGATVSPTGALGYTWSNIAEPPQMHYLRGSKTEVVSFASQLSASKAVVAHTLHLDGPVPALVFTPNAKRPPDGYRTIFHLHGGPHWLTRNEWDPDIATYLSQGYAVIAVNYQGSTGYGAEWRDRIKKNPGLGEVADIEAVWRWATTRGWLPTGSEQEIAFADPNHCMLEGNSYGGYLALLAIGKTPSLWAGAIAQTPMGDLIAGYEDAEPGVQANLRDLLGAPPGTDPANWRYRSPLTYVANVKAPVLIISPLNDSKSPVRQIDNYLDKLDKCHGDLELLRIDHGHQGWPTEKRIEVMNEILGFLEYVGNVVEDAKAMRRGYPLDAAEHVATMAELARTTQAIRTAREAGNLPYEHPLTHQQFRATDAFRRSISGQRRDGGSRPS